MVHEFLVTDHGLCHKTSFYAHMIYQLQILNVDLHCYPRVLTDLHA